MQKDTRYKLSYILLGGCVYGAYIIAICGLDMTPIDMHYNLVDMASDREYKRLEKKGERKWVK